VAVVSVAEQLLELRFRLRLGPGVTLILRRFPYRRAHARDLVKRNVALLCDVPRGTAGRPSKSLTLAQAAGLLAAAQRHAGMHAYVVVSLLTGARTEELRALTWRHLDLDGEPPSVQYGDRCERAATPRPDCRGVPSNSRMIA
jgi:integrase